jgi:hypothetical protein
MRIYDVYDRDIDYDNSSYDDNVCSDSYDNNIIGYSYNVCYGNNNIDNGYDMSTSGDGEGGDNN